MSDLFDHVLGVIREHDPGFKPSRFPEGPSIVYKPGNPWPFYTLSDGTLLCFKGRVFVRGLVDVTLERTIYGQPTKLKPLHMKARERAMVVHNTPGHIALCKIGRGNTRYHEILEDAVEGRDFELYDGKAEIDYNG